MKVDLSGYEVREVLNALIKATSIVLVAALGSCTIITVAKTNADASVSTACYSNGSTFVYEGNWSCVKK